MAKRPFRLPRRGNYKAVNPGLGGGWRSGGGASSIESPLDVASLGWWVRSDADVYEDQSGTDATENLDVVLNWTPQGGTETTAMSAASGTGLQYYTGSQVGTRPSVRKTANGSFAGFDAFDFNWDDTFSLWFVANSPNASTADFTNHPILGRISGTTGWVLDESGGRFRFIISNTYSSDAIDIGPTTLNSALTSAPFTVMLTYGGTGLAGGCTWYINGSSEANVVAFDTLGASTTTNAGSFWATGGSWSNAGRLEFGELAVFTEELSASVVSDLHTYATTFYGL